MDSVAILAYFATQCSNAVIHLFLFLCSISQLYVKIYMPALPVSFATICACPCFAHEFESVEYVPNSYIPDLVILLFQAAFMYQLQARYLQNQVKKTTTTTKKMLRFWFAVIAQHNIHLLATLLGTIMSRQCNA